ncbi:hypothetical protein ONZ45_g18552 [Pleurotus djamor]|nr:hypothetical protein ONZ45_g18552 [Pleurotus djamor]
MSALTTFAPFTLRAQPFDKDVGGMYVTGNGEGAELTIDPQVPGVGHQIWVAKEADGGDGGFIIVDNKDQAYGWTYTEPGVALTLSKFPSVFKTQVIERPNAKLIIQLYADNDIIGATWFVGTSGAAVIIDPRTPENASDAPLWELSPAED